MECGSTWTVWESNSGSALWPLAIFGVLLALCRPRSDLRGSGGRTCFSRRELRSRFVRDDCLTRVELVCPRRTRLQALHLRLRLRLELQLALSARSACEDRSGRLALKANAAIWAGLAAGPVAAARLYTIRPGVHGNDCGRDRLRLLRTRSHLSPRIHPIHTPRGPSDRKQGVVRPRHRSVQMRNGTFTQGHAKFTFGVNTWSI